MIINIINGKYINFKDNIVESICVSNWGDKVGITIEQAANVSSITNVFKNTQITSFDELSYFTKITKLNFDVFANCIYLKSIGDLNNITYADSECFLNCNLLQSVNFSDNITFIGTSTFAGCLSLISIGDLSNITKLGNNVFHNCKKLKSVNLSNKISTLGSSIFESCDVLESVGDLSNIISIDYKCFNNCINLLSVNLSKNCITIKYSSFQNCKNLTSVGDLSGTTTLENSAFYGCTSLQTIDVSNVTSFGDSCFYNCTLLSSFTFNDNVSFVDYNAFTGTAWYSNQPDGLIKISKVWYKYKGTAPSTDVVMDDDIIYMTKACYAGQPITGFTFNSKIAECNNFYGCTKLKQVVLNDKMTKTNYQSFYLCIALTTINMENITILASCSFGHCRALPYLHLYNITNINDEAFSGCTGLKYVRIDATIVPVLNNINAFNDTTCNIYVVDDLVDSYKSATNWSSLSSRIFSLTQFAIDFPSS